MKKILQAASVAALVLFGAVGCSTCCGSKTTSASPCANGQCGTPTTTTMSPATTSGMSAQPMPTTMTTMPGKPSMVPSSGNPALLPQ